MARIRKTASIASILKRTNYRLAHSRCTPEGRTGMYMVLESILHDAGLYQGFGYITREQMFDNELSTELPGISYYDSRTGAECEPGLYFDELTDRRTRGLPAKGGRYVQEFPDESRRFYYVANEIHGEYRRLEKDGEI